MRQGATSKSSEIAIFAHLSIVDKSLRTDPLQQNLCLLLCGITAKTITYLHELHPE
jgi:hypothetical protein